MKNKFQQLFSILFSKPFSRLSINSFTLRYRSLGVGWFLFFILLNFNFLTSFAQEEFVTNPRQDFKEIGGLISSLTDNVVLNLTIFFGAAAFTAFMYGLFMYILDRVNDKTGGEGEKKAKEFMLWSMVALFVMVSVWGIVRLFQSFAGVNPLELNQKLPVLCITGVNCEGDSRGDYVLDNSLVNIDERRSILDTTGIVRTDARYTLPKKKLGDSCTVLKGGNDNSECDVSQGHYCGSKNQKTGDSGRCVN